MSNEKEKLKSDEVPVRFTEWLLAMGCPFEKVPSLDSARQMCRGQYYIVWRSLMEEVESKDSVTHKRLTVFTEDLRKINDRQVFNKNKKHLLEPKELMLWREQSELKDKVVKAESRVTQAKQDLDHLVDKVSSKMSNRNISSSTGDDLERRVALLQKMSEHLEAKKVDLHETMNIASSMSYIERNIETESKLDKCISVLCQQNHPSNSESMISSSNPIACSSIASTNCEIDYEDNISSLVKCRGDSLWPQLYERRVKICNELSQACILPPSNNTEKVTPKSALAQTMALHCSIALETLKNKCHVIQTQKLLTSAITQLNDYLSGDACEYLVLDCERTGARSRVNALRTMLEEIVSKEGVFECSTRYTADKHGARRQISNIDKAILSKKQDLKKLLQSMAVTEQKIMNVKQCLEIVFSCLQNGVRVKDMDIYKGKISLPQESILIIQKFYEERRHKQSKADISLDLDLTENNSFIDCADNENPTLIDELRLYLDRFSLEKNRKLVLDNGEKIWIFETLQASLDQMHTNWHTDDISTSLLCPSVSLTRSLQTLTDEIKLRDQLETIVNNFDSCEKGNYISVDISSNTKEENEIVDKIKKRLNDNLISLEKISRILDQSVENIEFWNSNDLKQYISAKRTIDGKSYKDYEASYLHSLKL